MALKASTGLRNGLLVEGSFKSIMEANDGCRLRIYSGPVPQSADAALDPSNQLLVEITGPEGAGLMFDDEASGATLAKDPDQDWEGTVQNSGTAAFYRLVADGDTGLQSEIEPRLQGRVAVAGAELNLSSTELVEDSPQKITYYVIDLPTQ